MQLAARQRYLWFSDVIAHELVASVYPVGHGGLGVALAKRTGCAAATSARSVICRNRGCCSRQALSSLNMKRSLTPGNAFGALVRSRRLDQGDASLSFYRLA